MHSAYVLFLLVPLGAGFAYGRFRDNQAKGGNLRLGLVILAVIGAPVCILLVAKVIDNSTLGWIFALSLLVEMPLLLLLSIGFAAGSLFNRPRYDKAIPAADYPPGATACNHLQPLKLAMRTGHIEMQPENLIHVRANCRINLKELACGFGPAIAELYQERHFIDRSWHDPKSAYFWCEACQARLTVVHPEEARDATPWFPLPGERCVEEEGEERAASAACSR